MKQNIKKKSLTENKKIPGKIQLKLPVFWIGLLCFSSFWMFALGVWIGRGTAPVEFDIRELQKELSAISENILRKEIKDLENYTDTLADKAHFDFYEDLKKETESESDLKNSRSSLPGATEEIPLKKSLAMATKHQHPAKEDLSDTEKPEDLKYNWTIQVSSLKNPESADQMVAELKKRGFPAYRVTADTPEDGLWYRVRVGPYKDKALADKQLTELKLHTYDAILISM